MTARTGLLRGVLRRLAARHRRLHEDTERGTTLVEIVVGMTIMVICGSIFTGAIVTLSRTSNQAQAVTTAATENNEAFQTLDRTVRYAAAISTPGLGTTGSWYVELSDTSSGVEVCTQLRVDTTSQQLQSRSWTVSAASTPSAWTPLASGVTNGGAAAGVNQPFYPGTPRPTAVHQQLTFNLRSTSGPASQRVSSSSSYTLTALNSPSAVAAGPICTQVGRP